ncbi:MAG: CsbD family protein [Hyphomonadaceae bacterium]
MNWDQIEGKWDQFRGKVQNQWGKLTNSDLERVKGARTELSGRIQERYGVAKEEADQQIENWLKSVH